MKNLGVLGILFVLLIVPAVSAEIFLITQPERLYSIGDDFNINIELQSAVPISDFFTATLVCNSYVAEIYRAPITLAPGESETIDIETKLGAYLFGSISGDCVLKAKYAGEEVSSHGFLISRNIDLSANVGGVLSAPGASFTVSGGATKSNGLPLDGFAEVNIPALNASATNSISAGVFLFNFTVPSDAPAGSYDIFIRAYERDEVGVVINEGLTTAIVKVKQIVRKLDIAFNEETVSLDNELLFTALAYDQAEAEVIKELGATVYDPEGEVFEKRLVKTGVAESLGITSNFAPGNWVVSIQLGDLETTRVFYVEEVMDAEFTLEEDSLVVVNIGNVPYSNPVAVEIGEVTEIKEIEVGVGEEVRFRLFAPDGVYDISVRDDGEEASYLGSGILTGRAVSVGDGGGFLGVSHIIWFMIILVLVFVAMFLHRKYRSRDFVGSVPKLSKIIPKISKGSTPVAPVAAVKGSGEIQSGKKEEGAVVALKIKNLESVRKSRAKGVLNEILHSAKTSRAKIYIDGDYRVIMFSPILTKDKDNNMRAVRIAKAIEKALVEYNNKSADSVEFGIGVNVGDMIVESSHGRFKFTSLGNTVATAKKISDQSDSEVLLSKKLHRKVVGAVKGEKLRDKDMWKIKKITSREKHADFIKNFINRQKAEKKS